MKLASFVVMLSVIGAMARADHFPWLGESKALAPEPGQVRYLANPREPGTAKGLGSWDSQGVNKGRNLDPNAPVNPVSAAKPFPPLKDGDVLNVHLFKEHQPGANYVDDAGNRCTANLGGRRPFPVRAVVSKACSDTATSEFHLFSARKEFVGTMLCHTVSCRKHNLLLLSELSSAFPIARFHFPDAWQ